MRWSTGRYGPHEPDRKPRHGQPVPGMAATWTVGWPSSMARTAASGSVALAAIGECGADEEQLQHALHAVRTGNWADLTHWPGSYLVIARNGDTLAVIGDLAGQHPVYWRTTADGVWWSTAASALAAFDEAPADPTALAAHLALAQPDVLGSRSLFRSVHRVPTGHLLTISPRGVRVARYEPLEYAPVPLAEAASTVRAALEEAVAVRLDERPVSSDLAGLDSTTLACLAARHAPVLGVTYADERLRDDDLAYAVRTAATVPGIGHRRVAGTPTTVYYAELADPATVPLTDAPSAFSVTASIKHAVLTEVAGQQPGGLHFTGAAGDAVLSAASSYLADLLRERRYGQALRHAHAHARLRHTSPLAVLRRARPASQLALPAAWRHLAVALRRPPRPWIPQAQRPTAWTPLLATADWMAPDARRKLADALEDAAETVSAPKRLAAWQERQDLARVGADTIGLREIAADHGVDVAAPFLDNTVIRACLAVPAEQRGTPARYKPLLAAAMGNAGIVPPFVLTRSTKGGFNSLAYAGLRDHAPMLLELLGPASRLAAAGLITPEPVADVLRRAAAGQPTAQGALHLAVAAEVWLRQTSAASGAWWEVPARAAAR
ncbi:albusnodin/ikarugamycin family macrolactam cyclase [Streptomyces albus]